MGISVKADTSQIAKIGQDIQGLEKKVHDQAANAATQLAQEINDRVSADIRAAGNFGARWTDDFKVTVDASDPNAVTVSGQIFPSIPYWQVFQYGATIRGKPFLWFAPKGPVSDQRGFAVAKQPTVISVRSVTIPKKFHVYEIIEDEVNKAGMKLSQAMTE